MMVCSDFLLFIAVINFLFEIVTLPDWVAMVHVDLFVNGDLGEA